MHENSGASIPESDCKYSSHVSRRISTLSIINISDRSTETRVGPSECALAIAIPLTRESFLSDLTDDRKDFVKAFASKRKSLSHEGLWTAYAPYAEFASRIVKELADLGVDVSLDVTLDEFCEHLRKREVTTLVAHWSSAFFKQTDIVDAPELVGRIRSSQPAIESEFGATGAESLLAMTKLSGPDEKLLAEVLASHLNAFLLTVPSSLDVADDGCIGRLTRRAYLLTKRREALEKLFPMMFVGGNSVEFSDGLCRPDVLTDKIGADYGGVLDLTVCNSIPLGEAIRNKCERCAVLMNEQSASFEFRFALYRQIIRSLARKKNSYIQTNIKIRKAFTSRYA